MLAFSYLTADYYNDEMLRESVAQVSQYRWVDRVIILQTTSHIPQSAIDDKVTLLGADFGYGFDREPEEGGFDELSARNLQLQLLHLTGQPWLGLIDADELFTENTGELLTRADAAGKTRIVFECHHLYKTGRKIWPEQLTTFGGYSINDPHCRIFRRRYAAEVFQPAPRHIAKTNRTQHCQLAGVTAEQCLVVTGAYHLHFPDRKLISSSARPAAGAEARLPAAE